MMTKIKAINRDYRHGVGDKAGFATPLLAGKPTSRLCPKCGASPGQSCRRKIGGRVGGEDIGGGYWKPIKNVHAERKRPQGREGGR